MDRTHGPNPWTEPEGPGSLQPNPLKRKTAVDKHYVDLFLEHAQQIFDVAQTGGDAGGHDDFALLIRPDGGLHFIMDAPFTLSAASEYAGARTAYRVTRSQGAVRVEGWSAGRSCVLEQKQVYKELLRDQPLYRITSPTSGAVGTTS